MKRERSDADAAYEWLLDGDVAQADRALAQTTLEQANRPQADGDTLFHLAARRGHIGLVADFLRLPGFCPNARARDGTTALTLAAANAQWAVVLLLARDPRVNVSVAPADDFPALYHAAAAGHVPAVAALCRRGARPYTRARPDADALWIAARRGHALVITVLLCFDAFVNHSSAAVGGVTPLWAAAAAGHAGAVRALLRCPEIDCNWPSASGITPLGAALAQGHLEAVHALREYGAVPWCAPSNRIPRYFPAPAAAAAGPQ